MKEQEQLSFNAPQDLRNLTPEQNAEVITWFSKLPLNELRKRQAMCNEQLGMANKWYVDHGNNEQLELATSNLQIMQEQLTLAVMKQVFGDDNGNT